MPAADDEVERHEQVRGRAARGDRDAERQRRRPRRASSTPGRRAKSSASTASATTPAGDRAGGQSRVVAQRAHLVGVPDVGDEDDGREGQRAEHRPAPARASERSTSAAAASSATAISGTGASMSRAMQGAGPAPGRRRRRAGGQLGQPEADDQPAAQARRGDDRPARVGTLRRPRSPRGASPSPAAPRPPRTAPKPANAPLVPSNSPISSSSLVRVMPAGAPQRPGARAEEVRRSRRRGLDQARRRASGGPGGAASRCPARPRARRGARSAAGAAARRAVSQRASPGSRTPLVALEPRAAVPAPGATSVVTS